MVQLLSWMIPAEASPGTFVTLNGACGKATKTIPDFVRFSKRFNSNRIMDYSRLPNKQASLFIYSKIFALNILSPKAKQLKFYYAGESTDKIFNSL